MLWFHTAQDVLIYLVGDSAVHLCVEGVSSVTVQELGRSVREALHIPDSAQEAFAFWLCSPLLGKKLFFFFTRLFIVSAMTAFVNGFKVIFIEMVKLHWFPTYGCLFHFIVIVMIKLPQLNCHNEMNQSSRQVLDSTYIKERAGSGWSQIFHSFCC